MGYAAATHVPPPMGDSERQRIGGQDDNEVQHPAGQVRADGPPAGVARNATGGGDVRFACQRRAVDVRGGEVQGRGRGEASQVKMHVIVKETIDCFDTNSKAEHKMYKIEEKRHVWCTGPWRRNRKRPAQQLKSLLIL